MVLRFKLCKMKRERKRERTISGLRLKGRKAKNEGERERDPSWELSSASIEADQLSLFFPPRPRSLGGSVGLHPECSFWPSATRERREEKGEKSISFEGAEGAKGRERLRMK